MHVERLELLTCERGVAAVNQAGEPDVEPCGSIAIVRVSWGGRPLLLCTNCYDEVVKEEQSDE